MSEEELEQDELDGADEDDGEELAAADDGEADSSDGDEAPAPGKKAKAAVVEEELPSVEAKQKERDALAKAMEEFLSRGGKVQEIEPNVVADPRPAASRLASRSFACSGTAGDGPRPFPFRWQRYRSTSSTEAACHPGAPSGVRGRSCTCRRASCRACLRIFLAILRWIRGAV